MNNTKQVVHRNYFPHIDGMRAIAVLAVVFYHLWPPLCPGGFVGVDVFFVISGYLITGGILRGQLWGLFSWPTSISGRQEGIHVSQSRSQDVAFVVLSQVRAGLRDSPQVNAQTFGFFSRLKWIL